jgi:16S rRNA (guanine966-N2)-methyltransferase
MRIVAGEHRGRRIDAPKGIGTRPTADRVRESAFNLIGPVDEAVVLDLFAGSGAMGIEALSRGAASCVFVESDRAAVRVIGANLDRLGLSGRVVGMDAVRAIAADPGPYDLILCDPPYDYDGRERIAPHLARLVAEDGLVVYESSSREAQPEVEGLEVRTSRKYGSARLTLFTR